MSVISLLLVDDHTLFRQGLAALLQGRAEICVAGEAGSGIEALNKAHQLRPDLILMDIGMQGMDGLEALRRVKSDLPDTKVVMLTVSADENDLFEALKAGAHGYLLKNTSFEQLMHTIKGVFAGEALISGSMAVKMIGEFGRRNQVTRHMRPEEQLTRREEEVLCHLAGGATNKTIAIALGITEHTVKKHMQSILEKLHMQNRVQLALYVSRTHGHATSGVAEGAGTPPIVDRGSSTTY